MYGGRGSSGGARGLPRPRVTRNLAVSVAMVISDCSTLTPRCGYDSSTRRITFPSAATCKLESLRNRVSRCAALPTNALGDGRWPLGYADSQVEECFSLSQWPFYLAYVDDDGEEYPIKSEADLTEAIAYFVSGDDDHSIRTGTGSNGPGARLAYPAQKITMRVEVVVEYDGPSLSDTSSIASLSSSENSWVSGSRSGYTRSTGSGSGAPSFVSRDSVSARDAYSHDASSVAYSTGSRLASSYTASVRDSALDRTYSPGFPDPQPPQSPFNDSMAALRLSQPPDFYIPSSSGDAASRRPMLAPPSASSAQRHLRLAPSGPSPSTLSSNSPISPSETAIPQKDATPQPPPSLLTQSELGSRWLREQSQLASRAPQFRSVRRYDSDNESLSDDEDIGDIALVRDERGREFTVSDITDNRVLLLVPEYGLGVPPLAGRVRLVLSLDIARPPTIPPLRDQWRHSLATTHADRGRPATRPANPRTRLFSLWRPARLHALRVHDLRRGGHVDAQRRQGAVRPAHRPRQRPVRRSLRLRLGGHSMGCRT